MKIKDYKITTNHKPNNFFVIFVFKNQAIQTNTTIATTVPYFIVLNASTSINQQISITINFPVEKEMS